MLSVPWTTEFWREDVWVTTTADSCLISYSHALIQGVASWRVIFRNRQTCGYGHLEVVVKIAIFKKALVFLWLRVMIMLYHPMSHTCVKLEKYWGEMTGGITQNVPKLKFVATAAAAMLMSVARNIHQPEMSIMIWYYSTQYKNDHLLLIWKSDMSVLKGKKMRNSTLLSLLTKLSLLLCQQSITER